MFWRAFLVWVLLALAEVVHGILRVRLLNRRVGDHRARQICVATGSMIVLGIAWPAVGWIGPATPGQSLAVGALWLGLMLALEIYFGRMIFRASWDRIVSDFDLRRGGLLGFGMLVLLLAPWLVARLHHVF